MADEVSKVSDLMGPEDDPVVQAGYEPLFVLNSESPAPLGNGSVSADFGIASTREVQTLLGRVNLLRNTTESTESGDQSEEYPYAAEPLPQDEPPAQYMQLTQTPDSGDARAAAATGTTKDDPWLLNDSEYDRQQSTATNDEGKTDASEGVGSNATVAATAAGVEVGVIMGSDSDLPTMAAAAEILEQFEIPFELTIVSAHRTPVRLQSYAQSARRRGLRVIIAGAGGAAHLPGMVPVKTSTLSGIDSLYSIVQMPRGVPVATVAIGNAKNAGILAAKILAVRDEALTRRLQCFMKVQTNEVLEKAKKLESMGWKEYLTEYQAAKKKAAAVPDKAVGI